MAAEDQRYEAIVQQPAQVRVSGWGDESVRGCCGQLGDGGGEWFVGDEQERCARVGGGDGVGEPGPLLLFGVEARVEQVGVEGDEGPAVELGGPPVRADG